MKKVAMLCVIVREGRILLAMKKRGFGMGKWNGFGGKLESGETPVEAVVRECEEEGGITPTDVQPRGVLRFLFDDEPELEMEVHIFFGTEFRGEVRETEEMRPRWFEEAEIPYAQMWADDEFWLPQVLAGQSVTGTFYFATQAKLRDYILAVAPQRDFGGK